MEGYSFTPPPLSMFGGGLKYAAIFYSWKGTPYIWGGGYAPSQGGNSCLPSQTPKKREHSALHENDINFSRMWGTYTTDKWGGTAFWWGVNAKHLVGGGCTPVGETLY